MSTAFNFLNPAYKMDPSLSRHAFPKVEHSEGIAPAAEFYVAPWLPVADGVYDQHLLDYAVITPGKIVSLSRDGHVCPAGLMKTWKDAASGDTVLTYAQADVDLKVQDLTTGAVVSAAVSYTKAQLLAALKSRGLLAANETLERFIGNPIGVAPYAYFNAFNHSNNKQKSIRTPKNDRFYNYSPQDAVAVLCDYVLELPWVPQISATSTASDIGSAVAVTSQTGLWYWDLQSATAFLPLAQDSDRLPWVFSNSTEFASRKSSTRAIRSTGDYMVDADAGKIFFYGSGSTAAVKALVGPSTIALYHYNSTSDSFLTKNYACVVGPIREGDYLKPTGKSNWMPVSKADGHFTPTSTVGAAFDQAELQGMFDELEQAVEEEALIVGQVLSIVHHPRSSAEMPRSHGAHIAWTSDFYRDRIPGSATAGIPEQLTYSNGANKTVIVNIIKK